MGRQKSIFEAVLLDTLQLVQKKLYTLLIEEIKLSYNPSKALFHPIFVQNMLLLCRCSHNVSWLSINPLTSPQSAGRPFLHFTATPPNAFFPHVLQIGETTT
jgi:hypothetical protein